MPAHVFNRLGRPDTFLFILDLEKIIKGHGISSVGLGVMKPICVRIREYARREVLLQDMLITVGQAIQGKSLDGDVKLLPQITNV